MEIVTTLEQTVEQLKNELETLGRRLADLEKNAVKKSIKRDKPVNIKAFHKAIDDSMNGDRKALEKYGEHYSYPT